MQTEAMATQTDKALHHLSDKLSLLRRLDVSPERHVFLLWIITRGVTLLGGERPIMVGGGAVEFYTGMRFATGDLDLVSPDLKLTEEVLESFGYERPSGSRHYVNRAVSSLVEIHSNKLRANEELVELVYRKVPLSLVSPEDCIIERLESYRKHGSTLDLLNAFLISYHQHERIDMDRLTKRLNSSRLWDFYRPIQDVGRLLVLNQIGVDEAAASLIHFMKEGTKECGF
jgi:hypothetical protein